MSETPVLAKPQVHTYQTRLASNAAIDAALGAFAELYGRAERSLFAEKQKPDFDGNAAKRKFLKEFDINARQFNAIRVALDGKIDSIKERRPELIDEAERRIAKAQKVIERLQTKLEDLRDPAKAIKSGSSGKSVGRC